MTGTTLSLSEPQLAARHAADMPDPCGTHPAVEHAWREKMIREAAYFRSLHRRAEPGKELDDWLAAEQEIEHSLQNHRCA